MKLAAVTVLIILQLTLLVHCEVGPRIYMGNYAQPNQFPYYATIHYRLIGGGRSKILSAGVLIHADWVLTVGKALSKTYKGPQRFLVILGTSGHEDVPERHRVSRIHLHPKYNFTDSIIQNNLALVKLKNPAIISDKIRPISFAAMNDLDGVNLFTGGYGKTGTHRFDTVYMQWTKVHSIATYPCRTMLHRIGLKIETDMHICTYDVGTTVCDGDDGAPLVHSGSKRLVGLYSGMPNGCEPKYPTLFMRVSHYVPWIEKVTGLYFPVEYVK